MNEVSEDKTAEVPQTDQGWLQELFEFEGCAECEQGADRHVVTSDPFGNRHATCIDPDPEYLPAMVAGYIAAGLWTTSDNNKDCSEGEPLDTTHGADDLTAEATAAIKEECDAFLRANWWDLSDIDPAQAGYDFLLTRNHHGAGFWDRGLGDRGERLTTAAHVYGDSVFYVGDDGRIHTC